MHPAAAQSLARDLLALIGVDVGATVMVQLTVDGDTGPYRFAYRVTPEQIESGARENRSATGRSVNVRALLAALPWALSRRYPEG